MQWISSRFAGAVLPMAAALGFLLPSAALDAATTTLDLPPRPAGAMTGSQFHALIQSATDAQREQYIISEVATGNVPDFLRTLVAVSETVTIGGVPRTVTYWVSPDYTAIGSDTDYYRMPMSAPLAQQVADLAGCSLPTRKMVNRIYTSATVKVAPYPYSPSTYDIDSEPVFWLSNETIDGQVAGQTLGALVGGQKKDVVVTKELTNRPAPARVAIYGWHQLNGSPIQPLSLVHESTYEDYSHGIRLVGAIVQVDGVDTPITTVLSDASLNVLLSDEGALNNLQYRYPIPNPLPTPTPTPAGTATPSPTPSPTPAPNIVTEGSFEGTFVGGVCTGWTSWTAAGSNTITFGRATLNKHDGAASQYWARSGTAVFDGGVRQTVTVTPGATYRIEGWMKRQSTFTGTLMAMGYDTAGGTDALAAGVVYTDLTGATDNVWVSCSADVTATGPALTLFARGAHTGTTGDDSAYFYLDEVSVREIAPPTATATPSPSPTPSPTPTPTLSPSPTPSPSPSPTPAPVQLVTNGGFEGVFTNGVGTGWTSWKTASSATLTYGRASVNKVSGSYSQYYSRSDTAPVDGGIYQRIAVTPGAPLNITGWVKRQCTITGTFLQVGYDLTGGTDGASANVVYTDLTGATDNVWQSYSQSVTATGAYVTIFIRAGHTGTSGGTNAYFYVDDMSVMGF